MNNLFVHTARHPSAILFVVQVLGVLLYPFMEEARNGHVALNIFGMLVLGLTMRMVRHTPGLTWVSVCIAGPVIVLLVLQMARDLPQLLPWSAALEAPRTCS